jgi:hypothetical protein
MVSLKQLKSAGKTAAQQQQVVAELNALVKDIERCERTIVDLKAHLESVNVKHQGRTTTREDIAYLADLLDCAKRKLAWEKQIASLQKRTPPLLERMTRLTSDPQAPPSEQAHADLLEALKRLQAAMGRLQQIKAD